MKFTAEQIKTFVKKTAKGNSTISQITIRNYIMERFLERLSLSEFKNKFILKGGLLIASIVRKDTRDVPFLSTFVMTKLQVGDTELSRVPSFSHCVTAPPSRGA